MKLPDVLTGGRAERALLADGKLTLEGLAAKVADGSATPGERVRLAKLLGA